MLRLVSTVVSTVSITLNSRFFWDLDWDSLSLLDSLSRHLKKLVSTLWKKEVLTDNHLICLHFNLLLCLMCLVNKNLQYNTTCWDISISISICLDSRVFQAYLVFLPTKSLSCSFLTLFGNWTLSFTFCDSTQFVLFVFRCKICLWIITSYNNYYFFVLFLCASQSFCLNFVVKFEFVIFYLTVKSVALIIIKFLIPAKTNNNQTIKVTFVEKQLFL